MSCMKTVLGGRINNNVARKDMKIGVHKNYTFRCSTLLHFSENTRVGLILLRGATTSYSLVVEYS